VFTTISNDEVHGQGVSNICFSNKGYQFAASWKGSNVVKLFDMRKNFGATSIEFPAESSNSEVQSLSFDAYGNYLLAA